MSDKKTILLVDDTQTILLSEKMMLAGQGWDLAVATNGRDALTKIREIRPAVVLLDIMMPELDGIEVCRLVKSDPETRDIPVIIVTTKGDPERISAAFAAGCNDYVTKPINKLELVTKIKNHIA